MKCTIKNMSPKTVGIFARINGVDKRFEIGPGKEMIADNYQTRIMQIYNKKGLITVTPIIPKAATPVIKTPTADTLSVDALVDTLTKEELEDIEYFKNNLEKSLKIPKDLQEVKSEVEQYVEDGYIKGVWSDEDIAFLKKHYPTKGRKFCSNKLNRNETSVQKKINSLGIKKKKKKK